MRANEFISEEDKLNEVLPLIGLAARGAARAATGAVANRIGSSVKPNPKPFNSTQSQTMGSDDTEMTTDTPVKSAAIDQAKDKILTPGSQVNLATGGTGGPQQFKISNVQGDNVEIENPKPGPGEPNKVVYKKDDVKKSMTL
jgi:hypothetical protein